MPEHTCLGDYCPACADMVEALRAEVERLKRERDEAICCAVHPTVEKELAEAREALEPFAEAARLYCIKDGVDPTARVGVFAHDLRRAARVLGEGKP